MPILI